MAPTPKIIDERVVKSLCRLHYSCKQIATELGVHPRTLNRWRSETQFESGVVGFNDEDLDTFVLTNKQKNRGEVYIDGLLRASGYSVPRSQLRASIDRVDREGRVGASERTGTHASRGLLTARATESDSTKSLLEVAPAFSELFF